MGLMASTKWCWVVLAGLVLAPGSGVGLAGAAKAKFERGEVESVMEFWGSEGRYEVALPVGALESGPFAVRQTAEGSSWLLHYYRARGQVGKVIPTQEPRAMTERQRAWDDWIEARYTMDEWLAGQEAWRRNQESVGRSLPGPRGPRPAEPGPVPSDLRELAGEPPVFVAAVTPRAHRVVFDDFAYTVQDNPNVRRKFAFLRFPQGVMDVGRPMRGQTLDSLRPLFTKAGVSESELRVMSAVSLLEGGFDSLNTYDTGFVSVGFIQFASLRGGAGSLGRVLLTMKQSSGEAFQRHFRAFGLDVDESGTLVAVDPSTGVEYRGLDANMAIIRDKRLAAIFVRAGRLSEEFKIAQIRTAKEMYYPADDVLTVRLGDRTLTGRVSDVFRTEAGIATLMDRKVNTGNLGQLEDLVAATMRSYGFRSLREVAQVERQLVRAMTYRKSYLSVANLSQPRDVPLVASRSDGGGGARAGARSGSGGARRR